MKNEKKILQTVNGVIFDRLIQLIEEMSCNEFVDMISDKLEEEGIVIKTEKKREELKEVIGSRVIPLLHNYCKITELSM